MEKVLIATGFLVLVFVTMSNAMDDDKIEPNQYNIIQKLDNGKNYVFSGSNAPV